jgi:hypothetical protein
VKTHHIGGSLLPSNSPEILRPIPFNGGALQVVPDIEADTHRLTFNGEVLAEHPNGFSCHVLAERMVQGDLERVTAQADYIVRCGGKGYLTAITYAMP